MTSADIALLLAAVISAVTSIVVVVRQTRKDRTDIAKAVGDAWGKLVNPLEARVQSLEKSNVLLREENTMLWDYISQLRALLRKNDIEAPPLPELPKETA